MPFRKSARRAEPLETAALYDYAIGALGRRMRTVAEIRKLLRLRVEAEESGTAKIDAVIARLKEHGYLNDAAYAEDFTRLRQQNRSFGRRRVQQDLAQKGVDAEVVSRTLDDAYGNISEERLAREHLERRRVRQPADEKQAARVMRLLVRAGFSTTVVYRILKQWNLREDALAALDPGNDDELS